VQLSDLDSEQEDHVSDKDLDDLLNEDNPHFKKSITKEEFLKKSQIENKDINKDNNFNTNPVLENKRSQKYLDNIKEEEIKTSPIKKNTLNSMTLTNSILRASTVSRKNTNNITASASAPFYSKNESELNKEFYDEKVESKKI
jgi:hypothetical protein